jgi:hypothetical protein
MHAARDPGRCAYQTELDAKIGVPVDERWVAGKKVYIWGSLVEQPTKGAKQCQIRAMMNGDVIESFDYRGDETLCQQYAARLRP